MIFTSSLDMSDHIRKSYPDFKMVPVAAFGISHTIYENDSYENEIGTSYYHYSARTTGMFGYDYKLVLKKPLKLKL